MKELSRNKKKALTDLIGAYIPQEKNDLTNLIESYIPILEIHGCVFNTSKILSKTKQQKNPANDV